MNVSVLRDVLADAVIDTVKLIPFLFLTYLLMEWLEEKTGEKAVSMIRRNGRWGPVIGAALGIVPQCGFSAAAASLYSGGLITVGTLLAIFLSTSDEMLPIMISEAVSPLIIGKILLTKIVLGLLFGIGIDTLNKFRHRWKKDKEKHIHDLCEQDHCHCEEGNVFLSALRHTIQIVIFILIFTFVIGLLIELVGEDAIGTFLTSRPVTGVLLSALIGLIPNCGASVTITELYLRGILSPGQMTAGLLVGAGVGLMVLFRTNRRLVENLKITGILYLAGVLGGWIIELTGIVF
ncbi:MAG: putative manganese transporter [Lachnospiraceae bacterium]|nr:putative manganese transporter [Lachnospiraceae bacterium]